jgi:hypothetical protein
VSEPLPPAFDTSARPGFATASSRQAEKQQFGGFALILAAIVGAVFGFAAGYMARPRALQSGPAAVAAPAEAPASTRTTPEEPRPAAPKTAKKAPSKDTPPRETPAKAASAEPAKETLKPVEAIRAGRLLVRSTPSGASVMVDGVARGETPVAIRDLDLGSREISVTRPGYQSEERRIVLTKARPSRTVDVRLSVAPTAPEARSGKSGPLRPSTPGTFGKPAATVGTLAIESQPPGAAVLVNGKPSGTTPLTINDLAPGEYRVTMRLKGFRDFATTVQVVAGERARAAARLTEQEQE